MVRVTRDRRGFAILVNERRTEMIKVGSNHNCRTCRWFSERLDIDDNGYLSGCPYCEIYGVLDSDWTPYCEGYDDCNIGELNM